MIIGRTALERHLSLFSLNSLAPNAQNPVVATFPLAKTGIIVSLNKTSFTSLGIFSPFKQDKTSFLLEIIFTGSESSYEEKDGF